jgi:hypothetical protein
MVPRLDTAAQVEEAVSFLRYPPDGVRGVALRTRGARLGTVSHGDVRSINRDIVGIIQIESPSAVRESDAIAAIEGVDVLVGPADLSHSLGVPSSIIQPPAALDTVVAACRQHGNPAGILLYDHSSLGRTPRGDPGSSALGQLRSSPGAKAPPPGKPRAEWLPTTFKMRFRADSAAGRRGRGLRPAEERDRPRRGWDQRRRRRSLDRTNRGDSRGRARVEWGALDGGSPTLPSMRPTMPASAVWINRGRRILRSVTSGIGCRPKPGSRCDAATAHLAHFRDLGTGRWPTPDTANARSQAVAE